jgi:hypothetical protein
MAIHPFASEQIHANLACLLGERALKFGWTLPKLMHMMESLCMFGKTYPEMEIISILKLTGCAVGRNLFT